MGTCTSGSSSRSGALREEEGAQTTASPRASGRKRGERRGGGWVRLGEEG